jgi:hypothetical protein
MENDNDKIKIGIYRIQKFFNVKDFYEKKNVLKIDEKLSCSILKICFTKFCSILLLCKN